MEKGKSKLFAIFTVIAGFVGLAIGLLHYNNFMTGIFLGFACMGGMILVLLVVLFCEGSFKTLTTSIGQTWINICKKEHVHPIFGLFMLICCVAVMVWISLHKIG